MKTSSHLSELLAEGNLVQLLRLLCLNMERSPWCQEQTVDTWLSEIKGEAEEAMEAATVSDRAEELCDVLTDTLMALMALANTDSSVKLHTAFDNAAFKLLRRKPWLLDGIVPSPEEEWRLWKEVKAQEKAEKAAKSHE